MMTMAEMILQKSQIQKQKEAINKELVNSSQISPIIPEINTDLRNSPTVGDNNEGPFVDLDKDESIQVASATMEKEDFRVMGFTDSETESDEENINKEVINASETESDEEVMLDATDLEAQAEVVPKKKTRRPTMLHGLQTRSMEERKLIILNEFGQPVGPITEKEDVPAEYSRFLGTIGRDYGYATIIFSSCIKYQTKRKCGNVLTKYIIVEEGKVWTLKTIGDAYRVHKCHFKNKHYYQYTDDRTRWANRSKCVSDDDFMQLLALWKKKAEKEKCKRNREIR